MNIYKIYSNKLPNGIKIQLNDWKQQMDANEFAQMFKPGTQRSRLAPFWNDIAQLREGGYTLEQVCRFLAMNGVAITVAGLSTYIKRREGKEDSIQTTEPQAPGGAKEGTGTPRLDASSKTVPATTIPPLSDMDLNADLSLSDDAYESFKKKE